MMPDLHIRASKELLIRLRLLADQSNMSLHDFVKMHLERLAHQDSHINSSTSGLAHQDSHIHSSTSERVSDSEDAERILKEIRRLEDLVNAYTSKTDQILQRLSQLVEAFESLGEKLDRVAEALSKQQVLERAEEKPKASEEPEKQRKGAKREKTTVCDALDKQLVLFESEIADKIRNRDAFFSAIESRCNDIVIEGLKERIAVEKSYWQQLLDRLSKIDTSDDDKIKKQLDPLEFKLFKTLKESALLIYNSSERRWRPATSITAKASTTSSTEPSATTPALSTFASTEGSTKKHYKKRYEEEDDSWLLQYMPEPTQLW